MRLSSQLKQFNIPLTTCQLVGLQMGYIAIDQPANPSLFYGVGCGVLQVPRDITEEQLSPLFDQCGEVLHLNILRTQKGQSSGATSNNVSCHLSVPFFACVQVSACFVSQLGLQLFPQLWL